MWGRLKLRALAALSRLTRSVVGAHVRALIVATPHGVFAVDPADQGVGRRLRRDGAYGEQELAGLSALLRPDDRLLIVGAHLGALAVPLARQCQAVMALEPNPDTFELLNWNLSLNAVSNCRTLQVAANDSGGTLRFLKSAANSGGSKRLPKVADWRYLFDAPVEVSVPAARLDELLAGECFDVVLMDIEGSEYFALKGMPGLLAHCRHLVVEFLPHHMSLVAGVTVPEFLATIPPRFVRLSVPSTGQQVGRDDFNAVLSDMMRQGQCDDGIIFSAD